jgi:hypothetical protein
MLAFESMIFLSFETILHVICHLIVLVSAYRSVSVWKREVKNSLAPTWCLDGHKHVDDYSRSARRIRKGVFTFYF